MDDEDTGPRLTRGIETEDAGEGDRDAADDEVSLSTYSSSVSPCPSALESTGLSRLEGTDVAGDALVDCKRREATLPDVPTAPLARMLAVELRGGGDRAFSGAPDDAAWSAWPDCGSAVI